MREETYKLGFIKTSKDDNKPVDIVLIKQKQEELDIRNQFFIITNTPQYELIRTGYITKISINYNGDFVLSNIKLINPKEIMLNRIGSDFLTGLPIIDIQHQCNFFYQLLLSPYIQRLSNKTDIPQVYTLPEKAISLNYVVKVFRRNYIFSNPTIDNSILKTSPICLVKEELDIISLPKPTIDFIKNNRISQLYKAYQTSGNIENYTILDNLEDLKSIPTIKEINGLFTIINGNIVSVY